MYLVLRATFLPITKLLALIKHFTFLTIEHQIHAINIDLHIIKVSTIFEQVSKMPKFNYEAVNSIGINCPAREVRSPQLGITDQNLWCPNLPFVSVG